MDLNLSEHNADVPIVDQLWFDAGQNNYVITFLPDQDVSDEATEVVAVSAGSPEGRIIRAHLSALSSSLGFAPSRIVHSGGGDFALHKPDGSVIQLSDAGFESGTMLSVYDELKAIAEAAQCAFRIAALSNR